MSGAAADRVETAWRIRGRVQGVGFRWFVQREARRLGLTGWVCNLPDGSVECVASGAVAAVGELAVQLATGPNGARVDAVIEQPWSGEPSGADFEIRR